jgi:hypothetical protein
MLGVLSEAVIASDLMSRYRDQLTVLTLTDTLCHVASS